MRYGGLFSGAASHSKAYDLACEEGFLPCMIDASMHIANCYFRYACKRCHADVLRNAVSIFVAAAKTSRCRPMCGIISDHNISSWGDFQKGAAATAFKGLSDTG